MTEEKRVPILDKATGVTRLSEPLPVRRPPIDEAPTGESAEGAAAKSSAQSLVKGAREPSAKAEEQQREGKGKRKEIESLADFIESVYNLKGRKPGVLRPKQERAVFENPRLQDRRDELIKLARADVLLAVPRQLLLARRQTRTYPGVQNELMAFVKTVLQAHPMFVELPALSLFIRNADFSPSAIDAVRQAHRFVPKKDGELASLKPADLEALRRNAAYLIAVALCELRSRSVQESADVLFKGLWKEAAGSLEDDEARLRALTEIEHIAGVGVACAQFQELATEQSNRAQQALSESARLRQDNEKLTAELAKLREQLTRVEQTLAVERREAEEQIAALKSTQVVQETHLRDDNQQVRHRLVKRLVADVEQLETGLSALRNPNPRVEVMLQRGERVVDALRAEIEKLRED